MFFKNMISGHFIIKLDDLGDLPGPTMKLRQFFKTLKLKQMSTFWAIGTKIDQSNGLIALNVYLDDTNSCREMLVLLIQLKFHFRPLKNDN